MCSSLFCQLSVPVAADEHVAGCGYALIALPARKGQGWSGWTAKPPRGQVRSHIQRIVHNTRTASPSRTVQQMSLAMGPRDAPRRELKASKDSLQVVPRLSPRSSSGVARPTCLVLRDRIRRALFIKIRRIKNVSHRPQHLSAWRERMNSIRVLV